MSSDNTRRRVEAFGLDASVAQLMAMVVTVLLATYIAIDRSAYITATGASVAVVIVVLARLIPYQKFVPDRAKKLSVTYIGQPLGFLAKTSASFMLGIRRGAAGIGFLEEMATFFQQLKELLRQEGPKKYRTILFTALISSPLYYLRWGVVGLMMGVIFLGSDADPPPNGLSLELDLALGLLIALSAARDVLTDDSRRSRRQVESILPEAILRRLLEMKEVPESESPEEEFTLEDLVDEVQTQRYRIGKFFSDGVVFLENCLNLAIVICVLFVISPMGAMLAVIAISLITMIVGRNLLYEREDEEPLYILRSRLRTYRYLVNLPETELRTTQSKEKSSLQQKIAQLEQEIEEIEERNHSEGKSRRIIARIIFFSLCGLSVSFPIYTAWATDEISPRVALLYTFSMIGLWWATASLIEKAFSLTETYQVLMGEIPTALGLVLDPREEEESEAADASGALRIESSGIEIDSVRFGHPWRPMLLRFDGITTVAPTISLARTVKVVGPPNSGQSELLKLLTGRLTPTFGAVRIGGVDLSEVSPKERESNLVLIQGGWRPFRIARVSELFEAFGGDLLEEDEPRQILRDFELLPEFEAEGSGAALDYLVERGKNRLNPQVTRRLWLALQYANLLAEERSGSFHPKLIALDGVQDLHELELRKRVTELFQRLASKLIATFVVAIRDRRELVDPPRNERHHRDQDFVLVIATGEHIPPDFQDDSSAGFVVGGPHGMLYHSEDVLWRDRYRRIQTETKQGW